MLLGLLLWQWVVRRELHLSLLLGSRVLCLSLVRSLLGFDLVEIRATQFLFSDGLDPCDMSLFPLD